MNGHKIIVSFEPWTSRFEAACECGWKRTYDDFAFEWEAGEVGPLDSLSDGDISGVNIATVAADHTAAIATEQDGEL